MRASSLPQLVLVLLLVAPSPAAAVEKVIWQLGKPDHSDHEFTAWPNPQTKEPLVVRIGSGQEEKQWPKFHPGSANEAMGAHPYTYALAFNLAEQPRGSFILSLSLLFRHPRVPVLQVEVNGHQGFCYLSPKVSFELGDEDDAFNPIHSEEQLRILLPTRFLRAGENRLSLTCLDEPPTPARHITVGGPGDSGLYYDALALSQDPSAELPEVPEASLQPTVFFRKSAAGFEEECLLTVKYPDGWQGGKARLTMKGFARQIDTPKKAEFGETRVAIYVPDSVPAGEAQIELSSSWAPGRKGPARQAFTANFAPCRKWKIYFAPNEHLDIGYTDYQAKVAEIHSRNLDRLLDLLPTHPDYRFNIDGSWVVEQWLATRTGEQAKRFEEQARAGRIGVNAFYANLLTGLLSTEEFSRSLYFSKQLEGHHGVPFEAGWATDVPSYSWSVPSALASAGIRYFVGGSDQTRGPLLADGHWNAQSPFWWEGPDGQRVLAWYSYHYHQLRAVFGIPPTIEAGAAGLPRFLQPYERGDYAQDAVLLYGTEVENVPLEYLDAELAPRWNAQYAYPQIIPCRFGEYFRYVEEHFGAGLPVVRGDGGAFWEDGAGTDAIATARYREIQTRALAADALTALAASLNRALSFPLQLSRDIWSNLVLYNEHTFTSYRGPGQPEHDDVVGQLEVKEARATRAAQETDEVMRRGLSQLADLVQTEGRNLIVFNSLSWQRSGLVRIQLDPGAALTDVATGQPVPYEVVESREGYQTVRFWARDVPALGYKIFRLGRGQIVEPGRGEPQSNIIENKFYRLTFDPTRAALKSLYDKELGRELIDPASPYLANEYLYVSGGGTEKGRGEGVEATQLTHLARYLPFAELSFHHPEQGQIVAVEKTPWGHWVRLKAQALHTPWIETEVFLPDDEKRIEFRNRFHKQKVYAKEAVYIAFPWAAGDPTFRFDIANGFVNPERDLLAGADKEWFAAQNWVSVEDRPTQGGSAAMTLAVVDAPLVSLGDINRGRWPEKFTKSSATVFSYALNNYWFTNTRAGQFGDFVLRYVITSGSRFDPQRAARFGREARSPLEVAEIRGSDKGDWAKGVLPSGSASLLGVEPENLIVSAIKGTEDGQGLIVRIIETAGKPTEGKVTFPSSAIASAYQANAVEEPAKQLAADEHSARFEIGPYQVLTLRVQTR
jgi:hypothetical protein